MADLWNQFPDLQPSAIRRVLGSLRKKSLIDQAGDESRVYLGGVTWWATGKAQTSLQSGLKRIAEGLGAAMPGLPGLN